MTLKEIFLLGQQLNLKNIWIQFDKNKQIIRMILQQHNHIGAECPKNLARKGGLIKGSFTIKTVGCDII